MAFTVIIAYCLKYENNSLYILYELHFEINQKSIAIYLDCRPGLCIGQKRQTCVSANPTDLNV